jgi:hypothetical protein
MLMAIALNRPARPRGQAAVRTIQPHDDPDSWQVKLVKVFQGEMTADDFLKEAEKAGGHQVDRMGIAHSYVGMLASPGRPQNAPLLETAPYLDRTWLEYSVIVPGAAPRAARLTTPIAPMIADPCPAIHGITAQRQRQRRLPPPHAICALIPSVAALGSRSWRDTGAYDWAPSAGMVPPPGHASTTGGSAASRRPSPMKLKASTTMMTGTIAASAR